MNKPQPKKGILDIAPYVGGKSKAGPGIEVVKLSSNETPLGPSPEARAAFVASAASLHRYPDGNATKLREAIGKVKKLPPEQIVCGAGSDELIGLLVHAYAGAGDEVLYSEHGFLMYKIYAQGNGASVVVAPEKNLRMDVDAMLAAVTPRTKIVFIANPNNPTGSYITKDELARLHKGLPPQVILAIDGAYAEYVPASPSPSGRGRGEGSFSIINGPHANASPHPNPLPEREGISDYSCGRELVAGNENVICLRTFSKIYGLSALRLGWAYGPPAIIDVLNRLRGPFNVSTPAIEAGIAAMNDTAYTESVKHFNTHWLGWLSQEISKLGLKVAPSAANFVLVEFAAGKHSAASAAAFLMERGLIVRDVVAYGLPNHLRITVGREEDNKAIIKVLADFLA